MPAERVRRVHFLFGVITVRSNGALCSRAGNRIVGVVETEGGDGCLADVQHSAAHHVDQPSVGRDKEGPSRFSKLAVPRADW